jgi:hypothetical protein
MTQPVKMDYTSETSPNWSPEPEFNELFLRNVENYFNDRIKSRGVVFLNEVLVELGLGRTQEGQIVGWSAGSHISFGGVVHQNGVYLLEFNVDGNVLSELNKGKTADEQLEIEMELHRKLFKVLDAHPHVVETRKLHDYLDFFFNPGEVIFQDTVHVADEKDLGSDILDEDRAEVILSENGYLMHVKVPHEQEEDGGMWVEVHSVESSTKHDNHDKFKRMLGRPVRVTVDILERRS